MWSGKHLKQMQSSLIFFEQQTWKSKDLKNRTSPLHWQAGFIIVAETGEITLNNAQNSARTEVLKGEMFALDSAEYQFELHFKSIAFLNDARMINSTRIYNFAGDRLFYTLSMSIQAAPKHETHLTCELRRI
jgi:hypothetical protein